MFYKYILVVFFLFNSNSIFGEFNIHGKWDISGRGMKKSLLFNDDGTGLFKRGDQSFTISSFDLSACNVADQFFLNYTIQFEGEYHNYYCVLKVKGQNQIIIQVFDNDASQTSFLEKELQNGLDGSRN